MPCCLLLVSGVLSGCSSPKDEALDYYYQAQAAVEAGNTAEAKQCLTKSIELEPTAYALYHRATLRLQEGDAAGATADCQRGLQLDPEHGDLKWLLQEAGKGGKDRFQGKRAHPPSYYK